MGVRRGARAESKRIYLHFEFSLGFSNLLDRFIAQLKPGELTKESLPLTEGSVASREDSHGATEQK